MTVDEPRMRVTTNLAFGICLILLGTALMLDRLQLLDAAQILRYWPVALVLVGAALVIQSFQRVDANSAVRPEPSYGGHIFVWVIVAVVMSQAFSRGTTSRTDSTETVDVIAVMSRHQRVSNGPVFRGGEITSVMGRAELDLRKTTVAPGEEAVIEIFTLMGGATIRVPESWTVDVRAAPIMGGVKDRRTGARDVPGAPRIVIRGFIMMGGLDIRS
jgi:hypothetical protein